LRKELIDPAEKYKNEPGGPLPKAKKRVKEAIKFHRDIQNTFHPNTYAHYGDDDSQPSFGKVVWKVIGAEEAVLPSMVGGAAAANWASDEMVNEMTVRAGHPRQWELLEDNGKGRLKVRGLQGIKMVLELQAPDEPGDGTVPAQRSAAKVRGKKIAQRGYEHQDSYKDSNAVDFTLYGVVKIINDYMNSKKG
jgi:hypothetical protein